MLQSLRLRPRPRNDAVRAAQRPISRSNGLPDRSQGLWCTLSRQWRLVLFVFAGLYVLTIVLSSRRAKQGLTPGQATNVRFILFGTAEDTMKEAVDNLERGLTAAEGGSGKALFGGPTDLDIVLPGPCPTFRYAALRNLARNVTWKRGSVRVSRPSLAHACRSPPLRIVWRPALNENSGAAIVLVDSLSIPATASHWLWLQESLERFSHRTDIAGFAMDHSIRTKVRNTRTYFDSQPLLEWNSAVLTKVWVEFVPWSDNSWRSAWGLGALLTLSYLPAGSLPSRELLEFGRFCRMWGFYVGRWKGVPPTSPEDRKEEYPKFFNRFGDEDVERTLLSSTEMAQISNFVLENQREHGAPFVSLTLVSSGFLTTARSWLCNVQVGQMAPPAILFLALDDESWTELQSIDGVKVLRVGADKDKYSRIEVFGAPGYWRLMADRAFIIRDLLSEGVTVFLFETDQIWLQDPWPYIDRYIGTHAPVKADILGVANSEKEIGGNFLVFRGSSAPMRLLYYALAMRFNESFHETWSSAAGSTGLQYMHENDQTLLTRALTWMQPQLRHSLRTPDNLSSILQKLWHKLLHPSAKFTISLRRYARWTRYLQALQSPVVFQSLDHDKFVDGSWYFGQTPQSVHSVTRQGNPTRPIVVNNNFVAGIEPKITRAKEFGHWFFDENQRHCTNRTIWAALDLPDKGR